MDEERYEEMAENAEEETVENEDFFDEEVLAEEEALDEMPTAVDKKAAIKKELLDWVKAIVVAVVLALIIRSYVFNLVVVDGKSMQNTLQDGDRLFVNRLFYEPENGDIVVFRPRNYEDHPFIKRVIATEGQTIDIDYTTGTVTVDGVVLEEEYIKDPTTHGADMTFPQTVPENCFFAMGDNRHNSHDSRWSDIGMVTEDELMGHAVFRFWPLSEIGGLD